MGKSHYLWRLPLWISILFSIHAGFITAAHSSGGCVLCCPNDQYLAFKANDQCFTDDRRCLDPGLLQDPLSEGFSIDLSFSFLSDRAQRGAQQYLVVASRFAHFSIHCADLLILAKRRVSVGEKLFPCGSHVRIGSCNQIAWLFLFPDHPGLSVDGPLQT